MTVITMKGARTPERAPKTIRSQMDTLLISLAAIENWVSPPFQRPLRINDKVRSLAEQIKADGIIPGIIVLGTLSGESTGKRYLLDGQHRIEAFKLSEVAEAYVDVRISHFDDMGEMGEEFVNLNSSLVRMRPDDVLRGLEGISAGLKIIRKRCPFVGYDQIRRNTYSPLLSMSATLRCWYASAADVPTASTSGKSASQMGRDITVEDAESLVQFLNIARAAWGDDRENVRLWGTLNPAVTMWIWRRTVTGTHSKKSAKLSADQFRKCLLSISASTHYLDWLIGRNLNERDRSPCYSRIKRIFVDRVMEETGKKISLPAPAWVVS